ncbi:MAG: hypothetical protein JOZ49_24680 [Mycolicibacterium sp.]|nr:hypothetical protein [Mycolicibacterium sp.]
MNFLLGYTSWGAFPGHTPQNIGSGTGVVHNAFLLQHVQKAIAEIRSARHRAPSQKASDIAEAGLLRHKQDG